MASQSRKKQKNKYVNYSDLHSWSLLPNVNE